MCCCLNHVNHKFGTQKHQEEQGVSSGDNTVSESGLDSLPDYDEDASSVHPVPSSSVAGQCAPVCCGVDLYGHCR